MHCVAMQNQKLLLLSPLTKFTKMIPQELLVRTAAWVGMILFSLEAATSIVSSYRRPFRRKRYPLSQRGGNVIGGGDFSEDRLIPDIVRLFFGKRPKIRNPQATRPWQHVLDCLDGYFTYAEALATKHKVIPNALNFGPQLDIAAITVGTLTNSLMCFMNRKHLF